MLISFYQVVCLFLNFQKKMLFIFYWSVSLTSKFCWDRSLTPAYPKGWRAYRRSLEPLSLISHWTWMLSAPTVSYWLRVWLQFMVVTSSLHARIQQWMSREKCLQPLLHTHPSDKLASCCSCSDTGAWLPLLRNKCLLVVVLRFTHVHYWTSCSVFCLWPVAWLAVRFLNVTWLWPAQAVVFKGTKNPLWFPL